MEEVLKEMLELINRILKLDIYLEKYDNEVLLIEYERLLKELKNKYNLTFNDISRY